ncbi:nitrite reductase/ring-hydroxylating ferredoxin subunit [Kineococcus xinjiangensis]|uniref:Cytochrome bc1 complex Rieske iron-sulfur subunit n=1 Tax=Kineococcus xinjiangensis TaxID=512762 RepID=A0A2S6ICB6_9ACTN|nr:Rieske (2Fe-2S) protein [Kineococcus xinjiangensis]PPK90895.1 nitrite reductase/ring-hydroxylating ferredoxin subunit [Kineococcus xinjiangensis]
MDDDARTGQDAAAPGAGTGREFHAHGCGEDGGSAAGRLSRRCALTAGGVLALAACGGGESAPTGTGSPSATSGGSEPAPDSGSTAEPEPEPEAEGSGEGAEPEPGAAAPDGEGLVRLSEVPVGSAVPAQAADGRGIVIAQPRPGVVVAYDAECTHKGCSVLVVEDEFVCPCHDSRFAVATGEVLAGPAPTPLVRVPVRVEGGVVVEGA